MDTDLGEDISNAEMALNRFQSDANIEAIVEELNPETFGVPLDNPHLYFFGVNPQQYAAQLGTQPPADWKERIRAIIAGFRQNVRLAFRLEDFLLEEDDPEIVALLDYHRGQAQIAEAERKGNKVASKKRKVVHLTLMATPFPSGWISWKRRRMTVRQRYKIKVSARQPAAKVGSKERRSRHHIPRERQISTNGYIQQRIHCDIVMPMTM